MNGYMQWFASSNDSFRFRFGDFWDLIFVVWEKIFSRGKINLEEIAIFSKTKGPSVQDIIWRTDYFFMNVVWKIVKYDYINKIKLWKSVTKHCLAGKERVYWKQRNRYQWLQIHLTEFSPDLLIKDIQKRHLSSLKVWVCCVFRFHVMHLKFTTYLNAKLGI